MGNVYFSGIDYTLSDISDRKAWSEELGLSYIFRVVNGFFRGDEYVTIICIW